MRTQMKRRSHKEEELTRSFRDTWKSTVASLTRLTDSFDSTARGFHLPTLESELPSFEEIRRPRVNQAVCHQGAVACCDDTAMAHP